MHTKRPSTSTVALIIPNPIYLPGSECTLQPSERPAYPGGKNVEFIYGACKSRRPSQIQPIFFSRQRGP